MSSIFSFLPGWLPRRLDQHLYLLPETYKVSCECLFIENWSESSVISVFQNFKGIHISSSLTKNFLLSLNLPSFTLSIDCLSIVFFDSFYRLTWFEKLGGGPRYGIKFYKFIPPPLLTGDALPNMSSKLSISSSSSTIFDSSSFIGPG